MLNYIVFLKYIDIGDKLDELESKFRIKDSLSIWIKLIKLELSIFLVAHAICCLYLKIGIEQSNAGQFSWLESYELINEPLNEQYLNSLYYCLITMTTIGYGDITPKTLYEKSFILVVSVLACGIFAYTFSQISEIVKDQEKKKKEFSRNMQIVNREMNKKGISIPLQHKVRKYFEHLQKLEEKRSFLQSEMIEKLPKMLKEEVLLDTNKQIIAKHYIFSHLSQECTREIALIIRQRNYLTGEFIINEDEMDDNLYFIWEGEVNLSKLYSINDQNNSETILTTLKKKDFFGHIGFFINNPNPYSAKAKTYVKLSYIRREDFLSILQRFPQDYGQFQFNSQFELNSLHNINQKERYCYFKDNVSLYQQVSILETKCISCGDYNHQLHMCPSVHQITSIARYGQSAQNTIKNQDINMKIQRKSFKFNSLNQAEVLNVNIAEYWCMKADDDGASIYSDIQDVIRLQDQENINFVQNPITEKDSTDSEEKPTPMLPYQQKLTFNSRDSRDVKKQTHQKINSDSFDVTSEQHIQNYQNFDNRQKLELIKTVDFDNNTFQLKGRNIRSAHDLLKQSKSDIMVLQEADSEFNQINHDKHNNSAVLKKEEISDINVISIQNHIPNQNSNSQNVISFPSIGLIKQNSYKKNTLDINNPIKDDISKKRYMNLNGIVTNSEQNKEFQQQSTNQFLEISKEEDIENSNSNYSYTVSSSKKNNKRIHHLLIRLRAEKAKQYEKQIEHSPSKFNPIEQFSSILKQTQTLCLSPLRMKKKVLKSQSTLDVEPLSGDLTIKRNETRKPTQKSNSYLPFETNISNLNPYVYKDESEHSKPQSYKNNKESFLKNFIEKRKENIIEGRLSDQVVKMNTQNLMNYIKMMQENQLILPLLENKILNIFDLNKKQSINQCNSIATSNYNNSYYANNSNRSHHDKDLVSQLDQKKDKEKQLQFINKMQLQVMTSAFKKTEQKEQNKQNQIQNLQHLNSFFPVNENIIRRNSGNMDLDLLIYRKNWLIQLQQNQQFSGEHIEYDNEIDIDVGKNYKIYFPLGNLDKILSKYNKSIIYLNKKTNHNRIGRSSKSPVKLRDARQSVNKTLIFKQKLNSIVKDQNS